MNRAIIAVTIGVALVGMFAAPAVAQNDEARITVDFTGESLNQVLQMFKRAYGLEYTLGEGVNADMSITTYLRDVTLEQALQSILPPNGLIAIQQNGRYVIRERPEPQAREATAREVAPRAATAATRTPPAPTRSTGAYEPRRGAAAADAEDDEEERDEIMEVIFPNFMGAGMGAMIFGGGMIEPFAMGGMGSSGGYGTSGRSGYGSSGRSGMGSSGRSGMGSSGFGSSGRSSSRSSFGGSSSRSSYR